MSFNSHSKSGTQPRIEETRQRSAASPEGVGLPRGVLKAEGSAEGVFSHARLAPPASLAPWVQHFWMVEWDLRDEVPRLQETLPHPSMYLVFEQSLEHASSPMKAEISGVTTGKFSKRLEGHARAFGVKFRPGGFRVLLGAAASTITDRVLPAEQIFGPSVKELADRLSHCADAEAMADATGRFLRSLELSQNASAQLSAELVDLIFRDPAILTVDQLAEKTGSSVRSLQRLFKEYVGVPPKWVIRRYRLHELVERLHSGQTFDGAQLALDLGYADQAHLIHDFRQLVGYTPTGYRKLGVKTPAKPPQDDGREKL